MEHVFNLLTHRIIIVITVFPIQKHQLSSIIFPLLFRYERIKVTFFFPNSFGPSLYLPEAVLSTTGGAAVGDGGGLEPGAV